MLVKQILWVMTHGKTLIFVYLILIYDQYLK